MGTPQKGDGDHKNRSTAPGRDRMIIMVNQVDPRLFESPGQKRRKLLRNGAALRSIIQTGSNKRKGTL